MNCSLKITILINLILLSSGCTTTKMILVSEPQGADVFATDNSGREEKLGQTPLEFNNEILKKLPNNMWRLTVDKAGFLKDQIYIESKMFQEVGNISITLTPEANWKEAYQDANAYKYLNDVSGMSAEIQAATVKGDYNRAESLATALVTRYPKLSAGWNLLGNIYYLQKRIDKALESYQKSLAINPNDQVTKRILDRIQNGRI